MTHSVTENEVVERMDLRLGGSVCYFPDFLSESEHEATLMHLTEAVEWFEYSAPMYDRIVTFPRLHTNMSDSVGNWTPPVNKIRQRLQQLTGRQFRYAHLGYYKTGDNYLGYHADRELEDGDIICSVSFGATRRFVIRERYLPDGRTRTSGPPNYEFFLKGGSLFIFDQLSARDCYKHSVTKVRKADNYVDSRGVGRVNITFREK